MDTTDRQVQTRSEDGELRYFDSLKLALEHVHECDVRCESPEQATWPSGMGLINDRDGPVNLFSPGTIWKISFTLPTGERVRLVREKSGGHFVLEQMDKAIEEILKAHGH
jgi:hypothetical protein